jgi:hypothetical protein
MISHNRRQPTRQQTLPRRQRVTTPRTECRFWSAIPVLGIFVIGLLATARRSSGAPMTVESGSIELETLPALPALEHVMGGRLVGLHVHDPAHILAVGQGSAGSWPRG